MPLITPGNPTIMERPSRRTEQGGSHMSNIQLFLSLAGFLTAIFAWFRFDINKRFDEQKEWVNKRFDEQKNSMNQRFDDVNQRFDDVNNRFDDVNKRFDDMNNRFDDLNTSIHKRIDDQNAMLAQHYVKGSDGVGPP